MLLNTQLRITKKGNLMKNVKEIYLQNDIPCQIKFCDLCDYNEALFDFQDDPHIYFIDIDVLDQHTDILEQSLVLKNIILLQSSVETIKKKSQSQSIQLNNFIDSTLDKCIYVYPDEFSTVTQEKPALLQLAQWYQKHQPSNGKMIILSNDYKVTQEAQKRKINCKTIHDFVKSHYKQGDDLYDYLGLDQDIMQEEEANIVQFEEYLSTEVAVDKIKQGLLFDGKLSVDRNDITKGKLFYRKLDIEIKITGINQNRAVHGDRVAIQLLPENQWKSNKQTEFVLEDDEETGESGDEGTLTNFGELQRLITHIKINKLLPEGKVVAVLQRIDRLFCGDIVENNTFQPADARYPKFRLSNLSQKHLDKKLQIQLVDWPCNSLYPIGRIRKVLGKSGDMFVEGTAILLEHSVEIREFSKKVLACLPEENYQISSSERARRLDITHLPIVSIDPVGCRDIDDALHCIKLPNGNFEVGVHIADVSHFVKPNTAIDLEAAHRCTTVYLVDRRTDMLPKLLTEKLCSLVSQVERLAFSVFWEFDMNYEIVQIRFAKTIIKSQSSLHYEQAQNMINQQLKDPITQSITYLRDIARVLLKRRKDAGALTLASSQVKITFDLETHNPIDVRQYPMFETNSTVEEFMLLANTTVAEKILNRFPAISVLRRHQTPKEKEMRELKLLMQELGYDFHDETSKLLGESLDKIGRKDDPFFNKLVRIMTTRCMNEALYVCTADCDRSELYHYGLAVPYYTHFTSPIRRYADVLVHRVLAAALDIESLPTTMCNKLRITRICEKMNFRHRNARFASRASADYQTYQFFKNRQQKVEDAMITGISERGLNVIMPEFGIEGLIEMKLENLEEKAMEVIINGKKYKLFDRVKIRIDVTLKHFKKQINLKLIE